MRTINYYKDETPTEMCFIVIDQNFVLHSSVATFNYMPPTLCSAALSVVTSDWHAVIVFILNLNA